MVIHCSPKRIRFTVLFILFLVSLGIGQFLLHSSRYYAQSVGNSSLYDYGNETDPNSNYTAASCTGDYATSGAYPVNLTNRSTSCQQTANTTCEIGPDGQPVKDQYGNPICSTSYKANVTETATGQFKVDLAFEVPFAGYLGSTQIPGDTPAQGTSPATPTPTPLQNDTPNIGQLIKKVSVGTNIDFTDFQNYVDYLLYSHIPDPSTGIMTDQVNPDYKFPTYKDYQPGSDLQTYEQNKLQCWQNQYDGEMKFTLTATGSSSTVTSAFGSAPVDVPAPAFKGVLGLYALSGWVTANTNAQTNMSDWMKLFNSPCYPGGKATYQNFESQNGYPFTQELAPVGSNEQQNACISSNEAAAGDNLTGFAVNKEVDISLYCPKTYDGKCSDNSNQHPCDGFQVNQIEASNLQFVGLNNMIAQAWTAEANQNASQAPICHTNNKIIQSHLVMSIPNSQQTFLGFIPTSQQIQTQNTFDFPWVGNVLDINSHLSANVYNSTTQDPLTTGKIPTTLDEQYCATGQQCDCMAYYLAEGSNPPTLDKNNPLVAAAIKDCKPDSCATAAGASPIGGGVPTGGFPPPPGGTGGTLSTTGNFSCYALSPDLVNYMKKVAQWTGTPASVLAAALNRENPGLINEGPYFVDSAADNPVGGSCGDVGGPYQFCTGTWQGYANNPILLQNVCNDPQRKALGIACPDKHVMADSMVAAALMLGGLDGGTPWTQGGLDKAAQGYCGAPCNITVAQCRDNPTDPTIINDCNACIGNSDVTYCQAYDICAPVYSQQYFNDL